MIGTVLVCFSWFTAFMNFSWTLKWMFSSFLQKPEYLFWCLRNYFTNWRVFLYVTVYYPLFFFWYKTPPLSIKTKSFDVNKSFVRIWDGEILICMWIDLHFATFTQKAFPKLQSTMRKLVAYSWDDLDLWLSLKYITEVEDSTPRMEMHRLMRTYYKHVLGLSPKKPYWDAYFFRDLWNFDALAFLYSRYKIVLITKASTIVAVAESKKFLLVWSVEIPPNNAFSFYDSIKNDVISACKRFQYDPSLRILISAWPVAKMLCYDLTVSHSFVCHDVGSVFDMFLTGYYYSVHEGKTEQR